MLGALNPSSPRCPRLPLYTAPHSCPSLLPRMPLEHRETQDWLKPAWFSMSAP
uniref:Alternative protein n=1 Tax=Mesocestoides corti TaxID=53468 RepID=A0A5K3FW64_MESCO